MSSQMNFDMSNEDRGIFHNKIFYDSKFSFFDFRLGNDKLCIINDLEDFRYESYWAASVLILSSNKELIGRLLKSYDHSDFENFDICEYRRPYRVNGKFESGRFYYQQRDVFGNDKSFDFLMEVRKLFRRTKSTLIYHDRWYYGPDAYRELIIK